MMISAALVGPDPNALIAESYDSAPCIMIADSDDLAEYRFITENVAGELWNAEVEVIFTGDFYDPEAFEKIADACVTRYRASGMTVKEAVKAMDEYRLPIITDYVGGHGCGSSEHGECHDHE